jgi:segregation and condensation protein B
MTTRADDNIPDEVIDLEPADATDDRDVDDAPPLPAALEAILMVVDEPVSEVLLAQVTERPTDEVVAALRALATDYDDTGRGFELRQVAGGWRFYTRAACAPYVERFVLDGQQARLTNAALETLAVVAYRQPVSRARVSAVRGVNVDGVIRTLVARGLIEEESHDGESGSILYRTTSYFLERLGLRGVDELPELAPFLPELDTLDEADSGDSVSVGSAVPGGSGDTFATDDAAAEPTAQ